MRALLVPLLLLLPLVGGGCAAEATRADAPMFKGVELYSWPDPATRGWRFALLPGTNRIKSAAEIQGSRDIATSVSALDRRLAGFAPGEVVSWNVFEEAGFPLPPADVVDGIIDRAAASDVTVQVAKR